MKKIRKVTLVMAVLMLLTFALAACTDDGAYTTPEDPKYAVTASFDASQGSVSLSAPASQKGYALNEEVTVTVTPNEHYLLAFLRVNGEAVTPANGTYTFKVQGDTVVEAVFSKEEVHLTVACDAADGTVVCVPQAESYGYGDTVTLTITPTAGKTVHAVFVNGTKATLAEGTLSVTLSGDTTVSVQFAEENGTPLMPSWMLAPLQGSVRFEGTNEYLETLDDWHLLYNLVTLFDAAHDAVWLYEGYEDGTPSFNAVYINVGGKAHLATHDENGKYKTYASTENFSDYGNPFPSITTADFVYVSEGVWTLTSKAQSKVSVAVTGYTDPVTLFKLYEENGVFTGMDIKQERTIGAGTAGEYKRYSDYSLAIKDAGTASLPADFFGDYKETAAHAELKAALEAMAAAESYTVHYHGEEKGEPDVDYDIFVTPAVIYENYEGWENGYVEIDDAVYAFSYYPETQTLKYDDALNPLIALSDLRAPFALEVPYAMLESKGNGVFAPRIFDTHLQYQDTGLNASLATMFADGLSEIYLFSSALEVSITLKDGALHQVEIYYDFNGQLAERVTLTYSNVGSTTLPVDIDFTSDELPEYEAPETGIPQRYFGTYKGTINGAAWVVTVSASGVSVTVNGAAQKVAKFEYDRGYDEVWFYTDQWYSISDASYNDPITTVWFQTEAGFLGMLHRDTSGNTPGPDDPNENGIPSVFIGEYEGTVFGMLCHISITEDTITVTINGADIIAVITDYDEYEGFTVTLNGVEYYLSNAEQSYGYEGGPVQVLRLMRASDYAFGDLTRQ